MADDGKVVTPAVEVDPDAVQVEIVAAESLLPGDRVLVEVEGAWWAIPLEQVIHPPPRYHFEAEWPSDDQYRRVLTMDKRGGEEVAVIREQ